MGSRRAPIIAAVGVVIVAILFFLILVLPKMHSVSDAQAQLDQAHQQQTTLEVRKAALEQAKLDAPKNQHVINNVHKRIPPIADEPGLIQLLNGAAVSAGIELVSLTPSNPVFDATTGLSTITVAVSATGSYFDITQFMFNIETLPRAAVGHHADARAGRSDVCRAGPDDVRDRQHVHAATRARAPGRSRDRHRARAVPRRAPRPPGPPGWRPRCRWPTAIDAP